MLHERALIACACDSCASFLLMAAVRGASAGSRTLFVHAGLHPHLLHLDAFKSIASANELTRNLLPLQPSHPAFAADWSPLWTRALANPDSVDMCDVFLPRALEHFDVDRIIVGHTPQPNFSAGTRCGGRWSHGAASHHHNQ